jgi:hypothetical protein
MVRKLPILLVSDMPVSPYLLIIVAFDISGGSKLMSQVFWGHDIMLVFSRFWATVLGQQRHAVSRVRPGELIENSYPGQEETDTSTARVHVFSEQPPFAGCGPDYTPNPGNPFFRRRK